MPRPTLLLTEQLKVMSLNSSDDKRSANDGIETKPPRRPPTWNQYYFRLRDHTLTKSPPRRSSFPGQATQQSEEMRLTSSTITSYTNTKNCFCVRTGKVCVCVSVSCVPCVYRSKE